MLARLIALTALVILAAIPAQAGGPEAATGAFTCDFGLPADLPIDQVPPEIERDRMYMAERPGMVYKHVPIAPDIKSGGLYSGGRYLFDTFGDAKEYLRWMHEDFALGGVPFLEREIFLGPDCHAWSAVGVWQEGDIRTSQVALRTERWLVPAGDHAAFIASQFPAIQADADARGLSATWLLAQPDEGLVSIVSFAPPISPLRPDLSFALLATGATLGPAFDAAGWEKSLDRTQWSLTIWLPYAFADSGEPSIWHNSPPLPQPTPTDGVCEPSRGETHANAPDDCTPTCGDGIEDTDETWQRCPSDVRFWPLGP